MTIINALGPGGYRDSVDERYDPYYYDIHGTFSYNWISWLNHPSGIEIPTRHDVSQHFNPIFNLSKNQALNAVAPYVYEQTRTFHPNGARIEALITWMNRCADAHRWDRRPPTFRIFGRDVSTGSNMGAEEFKNLVETSGRSNLYGHSWTDVEFWKDLHDYFYYMTNQLNGGVYAHEWYEAASAYTRFNGLIFDQSYPHSQLNYQFKPYIRLIQESGSIYYYQIFPVKEGDTHNSANRELATNDVNDLNTYSKIPFGYNYRVVQYDFNGGTGYMLPQIRPHRYDYNGYIVAPSILNSGDILSSFVYTSGEYNYDPDYYNLGLVNGVIGGTRFKLEVIPGPNFSGNRINILHIQHVKEALSYDFSVGSGTLYNRFGPPITNGILNTSSRVWDQWHSDYIDDRGGRVQYYPQIINNTPDIDVQCRVSSFGIADCTEEVIVDTSPFNIPTYYKLYRPKPNFNGTLIGTITQSGNVQLDGNPYLEYQCTTDKPFLRAAFIPSNYEEDVDIQAECQKVLDHIQTQTGKNITEVFSNEDMENIQNNWTEGYTVIIGVANLYDSGVGADTNKFYTNFGNFDLTRQYGKNDLYV